VPSPRIAIVGAGPGGLILARILHLHGLQPALFERETSFHSRTQGGSLDIHADTGQHAIHAAGLTPDFQRIARYEDQETRVYDKHATLRFIDTDTSTGDRPEVDRGQLRQMLLDSLPPNMIRWDHDLDIARPQAHGTIDLIFKNGVSEQFDLVVGADGAWSRIRSLVSSARPVYSGIAFAELGINDVDTRFLEIAKLVGRGLTFALGDAKALIAHRDANAHIGIYAGLRAPEHWARSVLDLASPQAIRTSVAANFSDWSPDLLALIANAGDTISPRSIHILPVGHRWIHRPGITLLGDAAHLMSPFTGEGANLAMRDAADLALALTTATDWNAAIASYETTILSRAEISAAQAADALDGTFSPAGLDSMLQLMHSQSA